LEWPHSSTHYCSARRAATLVTQQLVSCNAPDTIGAPTGAVSHVRELLGAFEAATDCNAWNPRPLSRVR